MVQEIKQSHNEKVEMYMKLTKKELTEMLIECNNQLTEAIKTCNLPVVSACKTMTFSVGDKVRITCNKNGHEFKIGEKVWVTEVDSALEDYAVTNNHETWQVTDEEIVKCENYSEFTPTR